MPSALIVHSKHTRHLARLISKEYRDVRFLEVRGVPRKDILAIKNDKDIVIGIGGGSVIDTAKIISGEKRCVAVPTTASGAAMTPYATVWGRRKTSVQTKKPILRTDFTIPLKLPRRVRQSTLGDALCHAVESFWSPQATAKSKQYSRQAISLIKKYLKNDDVKLLIEAGNSAGQAIALTKTNVVHAASYPITIKYGIDHGTACGMLLPPFIEFMDCEGLPELFGFKSSDRLALFVKNLFSRPPIRDLDAKALSRAAMRYDKIRQGPKRITQKKMERIFADIRLP